MSEHQAHEAHEEHTTHSQGFYLLIGAILLVLTATTVGAAFVNLGPFNPVVALLIATIKALLVVLFFMHVKGASEKLTGVVVLSGFFFLAILLALSLADYLTRSWR
ncbi:MAG TPA: cytochrome C oxidase subunit IV family protein [Terriglobales bacterium]|jgi:cytochrome c oxidase subunit 4|nr:cytochrome C oxidase subunit IV family protein [Terriglobales bacterium]